MTQQHPITPPPELIQQWRNEGYDLPGIIFSEYVATRAYQAGADQAKADIRRERQEAADQELEACVAWLDGFDREGWAAEQLRDARRPKPPSLKEEALAALGPEPLPETGPMGDTILNKGKIERHRTIRRALKSIPDPS